MSLPEGLHLAYHDTSSFEPAIFDAQDMEWVVFPQHDTEDPVEWFATMVQKACDGLGVTWAIDELGNEVTVPEFIREWCGSLDVPYA